MAEVPVCWKCGAELRDVPLPLSRYAECPACRTELHVCRMCRFFDPGVAKSCREPIAEEVKDKQRASFCDYLQVRHDAYQPARASVAEDSRDQLERLFGGGVCRGEETPSGSAAPDLNGLFGPDKKGQ
ncbi:MAG: hypothetical protein B7Z66_15775 [Chromatiales bacterium 21-64-14]|nr:MAG: hypothetical protein B7Z66_15775 [Chromatiales bacterium 21-64-14]HQU14682.1 hypothetical protein [Gammaproteobacteria bacterium]